MYAMQLKKKNYKTWEHTGERQKERRVVISEKRAISQAWFRHSKYSWRFYRLSVLCHAVQNSILLCCVDLAHFPYGMMPIFVCFRVSVISF